MFELTVPDLYSYCTPLTSKMDQPKSWNRPLESNDINTWYQDIVSGRVLCTETVTISPRWPPNLSDFWLKRQSVSFPFSSYSHPPSVTRNEQLHNGTSQNFLNDARSFSGEHRDFLLVRWWKTPNGILQRLCVFSRTEHYFCFAIVFLVTLRTGVNEAPG